MTFPLVTQKCHSGQSTIQVNPGGLMNNLTTVIPKAISCSTNIDQYCKKLLEYEVICDVIKFHGSGQKFLINFNIR